MNHRIPLLGAVIVAAFIALTAHAASSDAVPVAASTAVDESVTRVLDLSLDNRPSAAPLKSGKPAATLDDYTQERWRIKLSNIVPYVLLATPVILFIVLGAIRLSGVRSPEHVMLAAALVLVIQATLTVSLTAEGSDSLSASMGILGAIAGYLFGRSRQDAQPAPGTHEREPTRPPGKAETPELAVVRPPA